MSCSKFIYLSLETGKAMRRAKVKSRSNGRLNAGGKNMIEAIFWDFGGVIVRDNIQPAFLELGIPYGEN